VADVADALEKGTGERGSSPRRMDKEKDEWEDITLNSPASTLVEETHDALQKKKES